MIRALNPPATPGDAGTKGVRGKGGICLDVCKGGAPQSRGGKELTSLVTATYSREEAVASRSASRGTDDDDAINRYSYRNILQKEQNSTRFPK
jgi:hypothetical protein